ncbi:hypothetical protein [Xanthomonas sp. fls2-241-TYG-148]|uniref:hypothetical protein n=1 Tax=Xanthomonas sp. fls2-241-TYG-148 TaxID=3040328 RepID=UPI00255271E6|nr:hypothetical protein [Xanthomonas sp. fls2-241-TYG-148]
MNGATLNFDLYALARPKSRKDMIALANEVVEELRQIDSHFDAAFARCEEPSDA